ncbi:MAG: ATP synthase F1 subunit epsilon [Halanaerobiales bacterium]
MATTKLEIVTPERVVYSKDVNRLVATAIDGDIGILPGHTPLVTGLVPSVIKIVRGESGNIIDLISISDGFMEVKPEQINIVVRTAELPEEINVDRAKRAKERAEDRLAKDDERINDARATSALQRAVARINAANERRK